MFRQSVPHKVWRLDTSSCKCYLTNQRLDGNSKILFSNEVELEYLLLTLASNVPTSVPPANNFLSNSKANVDKGFKIHSSGFTIYRTKCSEFREQNELNALYWQVKFSFKSDLLLYNFEHASSHCKLKIQSV